MGEPEIWVGFVHVRPWSDSEEWPREAVGAFTTLLVRARDRLDARARVADAMAEHECDLIDVELERLSDRAAREPVDTDWLAASSKLDADLAVWCAGTFHTYEVDEDD